LTMYVSQTAIYTAIVTNYKLQIGNRTKAFEWYRFA